MAGRRVHYIGLYHWQAAKMVARWPFNGAEVGSSANFGYCSSLATPLPYFSATEYTNGTRYTIGGSSYRVKMDKTPVLVAKMASGVELYLMLNIERSD